MRAVFTQLPISTQSREQFLDVTRQVAEVVAQSGVQSGVVTLFVPHTTAAVTINENADPSVVSDVLKGLAQIAPLRAPHYRHREGNSDAHIKSSLVGPSLQVIIESGKLALGTWQGIYFCEFDGPRSRKLYVKVSAG
jgi:secondary thiamine-phosphate synthase enzyme